MHAQTQRGIVDHHGNHLEPASQVAAAFGAWRSCQEEYEAQRHARCGSGHRNSNCCDSRSANSRTWTTRRVELDTLQEETQSARERGSLVQQRGKHPERSLRTRPRLGTGTHCPGTTGTCGCQAHGSLPGRRRGLLAEAEIQVQEAVRGLISYRVRLEPDPGRLGLGGIASGNDSQPPPCATTSRKPSSEPCSQGFARELPRMETPRKPWKPRGSESDKGRTPTSGRQRNSAPHASRALRPSASRWERRWPSSDFPKGRFRADIRRKPQDRADATGLDRIEFQVSLNPGQEFGPLSRVASGGELSRISLALEVVAAGATSIPTLVFDEVDAGIGGGVAEIVGRRLAEIATHRQVLCVTHLAQVASQGGHHYRVLKQSGEQSTRTGVPLPARRGTG